MNKREKEERLKEERRVAGNLTQEIKGLVECYGTTLCVETIVLVLFYAGECVGQGNNITRKEMKKMLIEARLIAEEAVEETEAEEAQEGENE